MERRTEGRPTPVTTTPSTVQQLALLMLFVLPGLTYQFLRERFHGPVAGERDLAERVLRAIVASVAMDTIYALVAGPQLVRLVKPTTGAWFSGIAAHPRQTALVAIVLFLIVPGSGAAIVSLVKRRKSAFRFRPVPTAWDQLFRGRGSGFVRARLKGGAWVGGWYGSHGSHASAYPHAPDLYLESAYQMKPDGAFGQRVHQTGGLYFRMDDIEILEFVEGPTQKDGEGHG
jgi:hypothetical protein